MEAFFVSTLVVSIAELGDRSLFLALLFGVRFQRPYPVLAGMALGLFVNQLLSAIAGKWLFSVLAASWLPWIVGGAFFAMAVWVLIPEDEDVTEHPTRGGLVLTAAVAFFLLEMADKTQLAVITLAGGFQTIAPVVVGATLGILLVTTPALWLGGAFARRLPLKAIRITACGLFALLGGWMILDAAGWLPEVALLSPSGMLERFEP